MTRTTNVHKAQPTIAAEPVRDVGIYVNKELPSFKTLAEAEAAFARDAEAIADELQGSLPGGTLDRLVAILLMRKASSLIVRAPQSPEPKMHAPAPTTMEAKMVTQACIDGGEVITVVLQGTANPLKPIYVCGGCGYAIRSSGCVKHPDAPMTLIGHEP